MSAAKGEQEATTYAPGYLTPTERIGRNFGYLAEAMNHALAGDKLATLDALENVQFSLRMAMEDLKREVRS